MSFFPLLDISKFFFSLSSEVREDLFSDVPVKREVALSRLRETLPTTFDLSYIENAVLPALVTSAFHGEKLSLPMIDEQQFKRTLGHFASGVTVVTVLDAHGRLSGMTASAFCSKCESPLG